MMLLAQPDTGALVEFTWEPLFEDYGIPLAVMGMLVVFVALVLLVIFLTILPRVLEWVPAKSPRRAACLPAVAEDELSEETLVVIAAAVAATTGQPHRVIRIRGLTPEDLGWSLEGRLQHHQSHSIPHRNRR
jgi:sodium pump decarboxylase gamma subunit